MPNNASQPTQLCDVTDLTAFLRSLDPTATLLDVNSIENAVELTEGLGQHGGLSGSMTRISLTYKQSSAEADGGHPARHRPATIICKSNRDSDQSRAHAKAMQLPREALFLRAIQQLQVANARGVSPQLQEASAAGCCESSSSSSSAVLVRLMQLHAPTLVGGLPTIYYSAGDMASGTKMVLCEDLGIPRDVKLSDGTTTVTTTGVQSGWLLGPHSILNRGIADLDKIVRSKGWIVDADSTRSDEVAASSSLVPVSTIDLVTRSFLSAAELHGAFWNKGAEILGSEDSGPNAPSSFLRGAKWFLSNVESDTSSIHYTQGKALYDGSMQLAHANWEGYKKRLAESASLSSEDPSKPLYTIPANVVSLMDVCCPPSKPHPSYESFLEAFGKRPHTLVHGDFHPGNMVVYGADSSSQQQHASSASSEHLYRVALVDWEVVGIGSGPQDIGQYMISHFTRQQFETIALPAVEAYTQKLMTVISASSSSSSSDSDQKQLRTVITREVVVGALGRWAWLLGIMGGMETISLDAMAYFNDQVDAFMTWSMRADVAEVLRTPSTAEELAQLVGMCRP